MKEYEYDWKYGRVTLNWLAPNVGLVRVHDNEANIPGPYNCVVTVYVKDGVYELMGFIGKRPTVDEFKKFYAYLDSLGLKKMYRRFRGHHAV